MTRAAVLGGGRVGSAIARDLAVDDEYEVTVFDRSPAALERLANAASVATQQADLSDPARVAAAVADHEIVVGAVPGFMGYRTVEACLAAGKPVVDISFFPEDALTLDTLARQNDVVCLVDFGVAPGCSNLLFGHAAASLSRLDDFTCYVGGLPAVRSWPWEYRAPFSPVDVLEEYTRPARFIRAGEVVTRDALAEPEQVEMPGVGTLEAFVTDGLRTLLRAEGVRSMVEKTCRYPGHRDRILTLRQSGFLDREPVELPGGQRVSPLELTAQLLFDAWKLAPGEEDLTAMRVVAEGLDQAGRPKRLQWELLDRYDRASGTTSMARTTGYACTAGVRLVTRGLWSAPGVAPPEEVGRDARCFEFVLDELRRRGVAFEAR